MTPGTPSGNSAPELGRPRVTGPIAATWKPSAHQETILATLKRHGRLPSGRLWKLITPKFIDLRAHQSALRGLVERRMVKKEGKGRATVYLLP